MKLNREFYERARSSRVIWLITLFSVVGLFVIESNSVPRQHGDKPWRWGQSGMFGIYRTTLALFVVIQHVYGKQDIGSYAVHSFFCLSGFLMTLLMCETYKGRPFDFAVNRFLRLFPAYWVVAGATALMILLAPVSDMFGKGPWGWGLPLTYSDILRNLAFLDVSGDIQLIPTSWAVSNELIFYVLIAFGATATLQRSLIGLALSCVVTVAMFHRPDFYFRPSAAALSFAVGATMYHLQARPDFRAIMTTSAFPIAAIIMALGSGYLRKLGMGGMSALYVNMIASAPLVLWLFDLKSTDRMRSIDGAIGRLSYPIYLCHFLPMLLLVPHEPFRNDAAWFRPAVVGLTLVIATAITVLVDIPIERLRSRIRSTTGFLTARTTRTT